MIVYIVTDVGGLGWDCVVGAYADRDSAQEVIDDRNGPDGHGTSNLSVMTLYGIDAATEIFIMTDTELGWDCVVDVFVDEDEANTARLERNGGDHGTANVFQVSI